MVKKILTNGSDTQFLFHAVSVIEKYPEILETYLHQTILFKQFQNKTGTKLKQKK